MKMAERMVAALFILGLLAGCDRSDGQEALSTTEAHHDSHVGHKSNEHGDAKRMKAALSFRSGAAKAKEEAELAVRITDPAGGPVKDFELNHEKLLHLIVVSEDLSYFSHLHPSYQGNGIFRLPLTFPAGGKYKVFADFKPVGGNSTTVGQWLTVEGTPMKAESIQVDLGRAKEVAGKEIALTPLTLKANEETTLTFSFRDARTKEQITDLEPYLGATGHVVILSRDAGHYLHVHPLDEASTGPEARFVTSFPQPGIYKIWGQFQHRGKVITVPFVVQVE